jgi:predicted transcriptional regulator
VRPKLKNPRMAMVGLRLHPELKDALQKVAGSTNRSMSWHIEQALSAYVTQMKTRIPSDTLCNPTK